MSHGFGHKVKRLETCDLEGSWFGTLCAWPQSLEQSYVLNGIRTKFFFFYGRKILYCFSSRYWDPEFEIILDCGLYLRYDFLRRPFLMDS